jgi:membrane protein implicated in regulation of membrane protease activity
VQPGSLVFVAIIAIWAAYLLQHWVRRREYLGTARSVDRYSEAMRVLERRTPVMKTEVDRQHPVLISRPVVTAAPPRPATTVTVATSMSRPSNRPPVGLSPTAARVAKVARATNVTRLRPSRVLAPARGVLFLAALVGVPTLTVLGLAGRTPLVLVLVDVLVLTIAVVLLRKAAVARRGALRSGSRRAAGPASRERSQATGQASGMASGMARPAPRPAASGGVAADTTPAQPMAPRASTERRATLDEPTQPIPLADQPAAHHVEDPATWSPVPVPPPTYTLKDKAVRPQAAVYDDRESETEPEIHELAEAVRRAVNS